MNNLVNLENTTVQEQREYNKKLFSLYEKLIGPVKALENLYNLKDVKERELNGLKKSRTKIWSIFLIDYIITYGASAVCMELFGKKLLFSLFSYDYKIYASCLSFFVFIIIFVLIFMFDRKSRIEQKEKVENEIVNINKQIDEAYNVYLEELQFIPASYFSSDALGYFVQAYRDGKVSNLKEAMESYDLYVHRKRMENGQLQIMEQQQQMIQNQKALKREMTFDAAMLILSKF